MDVVVTGGAGFIGANLVRRLLEDPEAGRVTVVDDLSTGSRANLAELPVRFLEGTILDDALLDEACAEADAIVHLAALASVPASVRDPGRSHAVNVAGTLAVLEAARRAAGDDGALPHVVFASSSAVYGANPALPTSESLAPAPLSPYAADKLAAESYALVYARCYRLPVLAFRFFNVYGPLQPADHVYAAVIPAFVSAAVAGRPLTVHGDGLQTRDFIDVGSLTAVIAEALRRRVTSPGPVNLAFGTRRTLLDAVASLERILGRPLERRHTPPRPGDVRDSQADDARLRALFGMLEPVDFEEGLRVTVEWFQASSEGDRA